MCTSLYVNRVSMEFSRQEYWTRLPFPSIGDLPDPGIEPGSPTLQVDSLPSELPGKPICKLYISVKLKNERYPLWSHWMDYFSATNRPFLCHCLLGTLPSPSPAFGLFLWCPQASQVAQMVKNLPTMWETRVRFLGQEDPLEEEMAI